MLKAKSILAATLTFAMVSTMTACGGAKNEAAQPGGNEQPGTEKSDKAALTPEEQWAEDNGLNKTETPQELYEAAKKEGTVVIYSISSRTKKVKESFEAQYPGVKVDAYDISTNELLEKISREYESGIRTADVVHVKEDTGAINKEYIQKGIFHKYQPTDICKTIDPKYLEIATPLYFEESWWFYNDECNPNGAPISSWWDLTKPEWKGKFLFTDPMGTVGYMALMTAMTQNGDMMAEDYKKVFGKDIVLSEGCKNAGYEWIKRFAQNSPVFESSSGKIVESVGIKGQKSAPVGYAASSKLRERDDQGWALQAIPKFSPSTGIVGMNTLNIVNEAPHPNGAKLLIRWMMGEADGKGKGFDPFNTIGGWSARSDVPLAKGNVPMSETTLFNMDYDYIYDNLSDVQDFWLSVQP